VQESLPGSGPQFPQPGVLLCGRCAEGVGDRGGGEGGTLEVARDEEDGPLPHRGGDGRTHLFRLRDPGLAQRCVGLPLEPPLGVPRRLAVAHGDHLDARHIAGRGVPFRHGR
jgi:hypothetical protein